MKRISILFIVLGLISMSSVSSRAQRGLGGHSLILDDGLGHTVTITIPSPSANYTWTLPAGAPPANSPSGTTNNSILRWDAGTTSWLEDVNVLATSAGALSANSLALSGGAITAPGSVLNITAGNGFFANLAGGVGTAGNPGGSAELTGGNGGSGNTLGGQAQLNGGNGSGSGNGGTAALFGGTGGPTAGNGGNIQLVGGPAGSAGGGGGYISFFTSLNNGAAAYRGQITNTGTLQYGSGNQFTIDNVGNVTMSGTLTFIARNTDPPSPGANYYVMYLYDDGVTRQLRVKGVSGTVTNIGTVAP